MTASDAPSPSAVTSPPSVEAIGRAITRLGWDLYQDLCDNPGNLFFSPASVFLCLAMLAEASTGQTRRALLRTMRLDEDVEGLGGAVRKWMTRAEVGAMAGKDALLVGNGLWVNDLVTLRPAFRDRMAAELGADIEQCSFGDPVDVSRRIDAWIRDRTKGMIPGLGHEIPREALLVAVNAVFMHGTWSNPFERSDTRPTPFHLDGPTPRTAAVPTMFQEEDFGYFENEQVQALALQYRASQRLMMALLPRHSRGGAAAVDAIVREIAPHHVRRWWAMEYRKVSVYLPRFDLDWSARLTSALVALGMPPGLPASECCALDGATGHLPLDVNHRAHVVVDEEGTVAGAMTDNMCMCGSAPMEVRPKVFRADRPFLFYIADRVTDTVLFVGRVVNPAA